MLTQGFVNWSKRDFHAFIRVRIQSSRQSQELNQGSEKFGRGDIKQIKTEIETKTGEEVAEYHAVSLDFLCCFNSDVWFQVFWERYKELTDWQKWIAVIERGEERIEKKIRIKQALAQKVAQYQKPEIQLKMAPGYSKSAIVFVKAANYNKAVLSK